MMEIGPKITPGPDRRVSDADHLYGAGWLARRTADGWVLCWDGGGVASVDVEVAISEREAERLRSDPEAFETIARAHRPYGEGAR